MGSNNQRASTSSFTTELFGFKESPPPPPPSTGIFASIFPPPSMVLGRKSSSSEVIGSLQKQLSGNQVWSNKHGTTAMNGEAATYSMMNRDRSSIFQEERAEPCHLSSSLYYGGQDNYSQSPTTIQTIRSHPMVKNKGGEDDPNGKNSDGASRGNWWQGNKMMNSSESHLADYN